MAKSISQQADAVQREIERRYLAAKKMAASEALSQTQQVANAMKFIAPADEGELIRSIRAEPLGQLTSKGGSKDFFGAAIRAGDATTIVTNGTGQTFQNARLQEFGVHGRPGQPFFFPTWRASRGRVRSAIVRAFRRALRGK